MLQVQRAPATDLIERYTNFGGLNLQEERLADDLRGRMPSGSALVVAVLRQVDDQNRDDVAFALLSGASDGELATWAGEDGGRRVLSLALGELSSGATTDDERAQQDRVMRLVQPHVDQSSRTGSAQPAPTGPAPSAGTGPDDLIARYRNWGGMNLREEALAADLRARLPAQVTFVGEVVDRLNSTDRDDVAVALLSGAPDDLLMRVAGLAAGRDLLRRLTQEMIDGATGSSETRQIQRVMRIIARSDRAAPASASVDVEIITFLSGSSVLDAVGTVVSNARGHTAVTIGDLVYSFEAGWTCGRSRAEYLRANRHRSGVGQVLRLTPDDTRRIQDRLNNACGTGWYAITGDICTDATGRVLNQALGRVRSGWNPGAFVGQLDDSGRAAAHRYYPAARH